MNENGVHGYRGSHLGNPGSKENNLVTRKRRSQYKITNENLIGSIEFAKYHKDAMTSRRGLGLKTFTGVMILFFYFAIEGPQVLQNTAFEVYQLKIAIQWFYFCIAMILTIFLMLIEKRNRRNRKRYDYLAVDIDVFLKGKNPEGPDAETLLDSKPFVIRLFYY